MLSAHVIVPFRSLRCVFTRCIVKRDVITVRDGTESTAPVLARYCGRQSTSRPTPTTLLSSGDGLLIEFSSDKAVERQGFAATFYFVTSSISLPGNRRVGTSSKPRHNNTEFHSTKPMSVGNMPGLCI